MSGKNPTKKQKLTRKGYSLNYDIACPYCEEEWPMCLLEEHINSCEASYLTRGRKKTMRERSQTLYDSWDVDWEFNRPKYKSTSSKSFRLMPPFREDDENEIGKSEASAAGMSSNKGGNGTESKVNLSSQEQRFPRYGRDSLVSRNACFDGSRNNLGADRLIQNLESLLHNEWGSDVVLKSTDHEFRAHRLILGARSPVFAAMFQHDMVEKTTGEVDISDCSTAGFKAFLQYLYSGKADISSANVVVLYYAADKYQVDDLKTDCVVFMKNSLSVDTFCDVIGLSIRHNESDLQSTATQFFCRCIKDIVKTTQWQKYLTENPIDANELIIKALDA